MKTKAMNVTEKILSAHLVEGNPAVDRELGIKIDQTLTQDATGTMAYLQFESMGVPRVKTDVSVSYVDHNTVQIGYENADDHDFLQSIAKKYGIIYSKAGNGICHQLHLERYGKPGTTLLGSDSHTPTGGGIGQIAIGAGGIDIAVAMAGGTFHIPTPKVRAIVLKGKLKKGVSAKDVILKVLEKFGTKGNVGWIFEYTGPGVKTLDGGELLENTVKIELYYYENTNPKLINLNSKKTPSFDFSKATFIAALEESHFEDVVKDIAKQECLVFEVRSPLHSYKRYRKQ